MGCGFKLPRIAVLVRRQVTFQIDDFAHVRMPGSIAGENNTSLQRIGAGAKGGPVRSM
jgi:hypothetical protein